ncbi:Rab family GTPase [Acidobacteriota bacterium]
MIKKKICMLGSYGVGKTSLVRRFVHSLFSEKYHTTVGVKIDKKTVQVEGQEVNLLLWDIAGEDDYFTVPNSYLRGSAGYLLVVDGTRKSTFEQAVDLQQRAQEAIGDVPFVVVLNKNDLIDEWELGDDEIKELQCKDWAVLQSSAKFGTGVEEAFRTIATKLLL